MTILRLAFLFISLAVASQSAVAADSEFVGILALATEEEVADELGLSPPVRRELLDLVDQREDDALELAMSLRDLPASERAKQLGPFRKTSETMGLKLLKPAQIKLLQAIRIRKLGMQSLGEPAVASKLKLTDEQKQQVVDLLAQRKAATSKRATGVIDRQLKSVLTAEQMVAWQGITKPQANIKAGAKKKFAGKGNLRSDNTRGEIIIDGQPTKGSPLTADGKMQFSFRYAPWSNVIEWFAGQSNLSLMMDAPPQGTFNYSDPREYTPAQAIDLLNSVLLTKGYTLVRREQMLMVVNLEDGVPPNLITEVSIDKLDELGEYELAKCLFTLRGVDATEAAEEIGRLVGPQGKVNVLTSSNQLQITETAGRLRTFRKILEAGEQQSGATLGSATLLRLRYVRANDILTSWRKLMGLTEEDNVTADGSLRVAKGKTSRQLVVSGQPHRVVEFTDLVDLLDVPAGDGTGINTPQLEVYPVTEADPASVLSVMQELFVDIEEIRLATDPTTGSLVALATPQEHATIRATIEQMQRDRRQVEVIRLRSVDPQLAMLSIEKLFGPPEGAEDESKPNNAPRVDADPTSRSLLIRGSEAQIKDIRSLLVKMGEQPESADGSGGFASGRGNLRMIPIDAATAKRAMEQLNSIWPTVRQNRIRTVTPSSSIRGERPGIQIGPPSGQPTVPSDKSTSHQKDLTSRYIVNQLEDDASTATEESDSVVATEDLPEVIVTIGDQGLLIASEDTAALDEFEDLFLTLADKLFTGSRELSIFYLKYAKADVAAEVVKQFIGGGSSSSSGGGTMLGSLASAALGSMGGGIMGSLMGGGGGASAALSSGTTVLADPRLNALVVQATPTELDFIEDLLIVLDKSKSPERIETIPRPRAIPVINTDASEVADIVRSVYASRMAGGAGQGQRQPSPEEFIRAMSGQKNSGKSISDSVREQVQVTISVDTRRNALLVVAPESTFNEIKELVAELDFATPELSDTIRYGRAGASSPEIIRNAISTLILDEAEESKPKQKKETTKSPSNPSPNRSGEEMRRGMEFMKAMQQRAAKERAAAAKKKGAIGRGK